MSKETLVFVGSLNREAPYFQGARGHGLSVYAFNEDTGDAELLTESTQVDNPSYLTVNPEGTHLYAVSEVFGWHEGLVSAFAFDRAAKSLRYINVQPTLGSIAAHCSLTADGSKLLVANYSMGEGGPDQSVAVFGVREDGGLTSPLASVAHEGTGPNADRQERSHAHSINEVGEGIAIVADLGIDKLVAYRVDDAGELEEVASFATKPGAGPRHIALHPNGSMIFVMNELDSTVASIRLDQASGEMTLLDTKPAVPDEARDGNHCADIQVSPDGRFVYGSNRGHDSVPVFSVDQESGALTLVEYVPCGGSTPRNIALTPSGRYLFSANQNGDAVTILARDADTGKLTDIGKPIKIGTPMCVKMVTR